MDIEDFTQSNVVAAPAVARDSIWVADDNADVRLLLNRAFKRCDTGVPVEFFRDGGAVVRKVHECGGAPKVLLMDFEMPCMDGLQTLKTLGNERFLAGTTVVIFSTVDDASCVQEAYASGARFYVRKPTDGHQYRQLARLCSACVYVPVQQCERQALNVEQALSIVADQTANTPHTGAR